MNTERFHALLDAADICRKYAANLLELPNAASVALECSVMLTEEAERVLTVTENGPEPCQEKNKPE